jgi:hypothetical protein
LITRQGVEPNAPNEGATTFFAPSRGTRMSRSAPALPRQFAPAKEFDEFTAG